VRTEGRLTFASAPRFGDHLHALLAEAKPHVLLLDLRAVPDIEYTALRMMIALDEKLQEGGIALWLAALNPSALEVVRRSPLGRTLGNERMYHNAQEAVAAFLASPGQSSSGKNTRT
jgi:sulfate permease, SulP family